MQAANLTVPLRAAATSACVISGAPVPGTRCRHAPEATRNCGLLARGITLFFGTFPLLSGSGKLDTPWERMQREKASAPVACADPAEALVKEDALPPHPQTIRTTAAVATTVQ
jgi:hypothetical protein